MSELESNYYFKQVVAGVPPETLAKLGPALLALAAERAKGEDGQNAGAAPKLRAAWLAVARALLSSVRGGLSPAQQLFLFSGALADKVELTDPASGGKVLLELMPTESYAALLQDYTQLLAACQLCDGRPESKPLSAAELKVATAHEAAALEAQARLLQDLDCVLLPLQRFSLLSRGELEPYNPEQNTKAHTPHRDVQRELHAKRHELEQTVANLRAAQGRLTGSAREMMELLKAERLAPALREIGELNRLAAALIQSAEQDYSSLAQSELSGAQLAAGNSALSLLSQEMKRSLDGVNIDAEQLRQHLLRSRELAYEIHLAGSSGGGRRCSSGPLVLSGEGLSRALADLEAVQRSAEAGLVAEHRGSIHGSSVLVYEQLTRLDDPLRECFATPGNIAAAILKIDALHPNCFPHDAKGWPQLPPIVVVPGAGICRWLDDRFLLGFVATEQPKLGPSLSFTPLEQAVLRLYGWYLSRGDIFNYRGERVSDSFMAEYAGEIEQKAVRKFTGEQKKMTIVGTTSEKDGASREDAVKDYADFLFAVFNGQPIPKRISLRKVGVLLKYCVVGTEEQTAVLALRLLGREQHQHQRDIMLKLGGRDRRRLVELFNHALENDPQVRSRFRELKVALQEVLPKDVLDEINEQGLLGRTLPPQPPAASPGAPPAQKEAVPARSGEPLNYFDL